MSGYSLDSVTIDGFRGLKNLRLGELGRVNILVGANNSGKTSILEALSILCKPLDPSEWVWMVRRRDFGGLDETRVQSLRWCFQQDGQLFDPDVLFSGQCLMTCDGEFPLRKLRATYDDIVGDIDSGGPELRGKRPLLTYIEDLQPRRGAEITHHVNSVIPLSPKSDFEEEIITTQVWEDQPISAGRPPSRRGSLPCESLTPYSYQINKVQVRSLSRLLPRPEYLASIRALIQEFDDDIQDIYVASFRGARPAIYLKHRRLGPAPLSVFGDGLRRTVLLATRLPTLQKGGLLLIDEMEAGIHVSALQRVLSWLTKAASNFGVQVVATTHSLEAVDAIVLSNKSMIDEVVTFHLDQTEEETRAKRIYGDLLLRLRCERGLDVR